MEFRRLFLCDGGLGTVGWEKHCYFVASRRNQIRGGMEGRKHNECRNHDVESGHTERVGLLLLALETQSMENDFGVNSLALSYYLQMRI